MNKHSDTTDIKIQEFINKLDRGIDGTFFVPYNKYVDKAYKTTHFGLSILLRFAFDLLNTENIEGEYLQISFYDFYNYVENAKNILTKMTYIEGDRQIPNDYGIKLYENPKNYSVVELNSLLPITEEELQRSYIVKNIHIYSDSFITKKNSLDGEKINKSLTPREKEAFYGEDAKKSLGLLPNKSKKKIKI